MATKANKTVHNTTNLKIEQSQGYAPDYDLKCFTAGEQGEQTVIQHLADAGDGNTFTLEVKRDRRAAETGNIYIEISCNGRHSGIMATKATWFTIVTDGCMMTFNTRHFRQFVKQQIGTAEQMGTTDMGTYRLTGTNKDPRHATRGIVYQMDWLMSDFQAFMALK